MSEKNLGAHIWLAHLTTVTKLIVLVGFTLASFLSAQGLAGDPLQISPQIKRILASAQHYSAQPMPSLQNIITNCKADGLCAAKRIVDSAGNKARLEKVKHPTSDSIRRVRNMPSIERWTIPRPNHLSIVLKRFGRKARAEIKHTLYQAKQRNKTLGGTKIETLEIDLQGNGGGRLNNMLRVAALFIGRQDNAIILKSKNKQLYLNVPASPTPLITQKLTVKVGSSTASSAEIFTGLMRVYGKATIKGQKTYGKNYLLRIIPVNHTWQLLIPAETIIIPGTSIAGGLIPDIITQ